MAVMQAYIKGDEAVAKAAALLVLSGYNILTRVVGGRALIRSELYGKDDTFICLGNVGRTDGITETE